MRFQMEAFLTVEEVAAWLKLKPNTLRQWVTEEKIPSYKVGGKRLFDPSEIRKWLKTKKQDVA